MSELVFVVAAVEPRTNFAQRMSVASEWERSLIERMSADGWHPQAWGQGIFTDDVRAELAKTTSLVRWQPDVLAVLAPGVVYLDAKAEMSRTANHAIENMAHRAHLRRMVAERVPVIYVWPDWTAQVASRVVIETVFRDGTRHATRGSGTPFLLTPKATCVSFDDALALLAGDWPDWSAEASDALDDFERQAVA